MKLHRFVGDFDLDQSVIEIKETDLISQIRKVLRLDVGSQLIVCNGKLDEALGEIIRIGKDAVEVKILNRYINQNEPERKVILYCSILKRENFELIAQKAVEVGILEIVPMITERTIKTGLNLERLRKIIKEAAEQSGRGVLPIIREPIEFKDAVENVKQNGLNILCDVSGRQFSGSITADESSVSIFIGPEGGWTEHEIILAKENNFKIVSLGKLTLRAETAAIVVSYLAVN